MTDECISSDFHCHLNDASVGQNPNLCISASCNKTEDRKKSNILIPAVASVGGLVVLLLLVAAIFFGLKKRKPPG